MIHLELLFNEWLFITKHGPSHHTREHWGGKILTSKPTLHILHFKLGFPTFFRVNLTIKHENLDTQKEVKYENGFSWEKKFLSWFYQLRNKDLNFVEKGFKICKNLIQIYEKLLSLKKRGIDLIWIEWEEVTPVPLSQTTTFLLSMMKWLRLLLFGFWFLVDRLLLNNGSYSFSSSTNAYTCSNV